jgi:hypothetical protein
MDKAAKIIQARRALVEEGLRLLKIFQPHEPRYDEICALLKQDAKEAEQKLKVIVAGLGEMSISPPKGRHCEGTEPKLVIDVFLNSPKRERERLIEKGLVVIVEQWKDAYGGRVTPKLY